MPWSSSTDKISYYQWKQQELKRQFVRDKEQGGGEGQGCLLIGGAGQEGKITYGLQSAANMKEGKY